MYQLVNKAKISTYDGKNISVLKDVEAIRLRYGMYIGGKLGATTHLFKEVLDNSIDEYLNGHATDIYINLDETTNIIEVVDNGRGLPIDIHPEEGIPAMELLLTKNHSGGKFNKDSFKVSSGMNGIGTKAVNALSDYFRVISIRDGYEYSIEFSKGVKTQEFKKTKQTKKYKHIKHGSVFIFRPDPEILDEYAVFNAESIRQNILERSYSSKGLRLTYVNGKKTEVFFKENGIHDYIREINTNPITDFYSYEHTDKDGNEYEVVYSYGETDTDDIRTFVNGITIPKGVHITGFKTGLTNAMNKFIKTEKLLPKTLKPGDVGGEDIRSGLFAVINVKVQNAEFSGQVKDDLTNIEILGAMSSLTNESIYSDLKSDPKRFKEIANRIIQFAKGRIRANKYKAAITKVNNNAFGLTFSTKFTDCLESEPSKRELFIAEGESAGTSIKDGRDPNYQAVYALRGKILNTFNTGDSKILGNLELNELTKVLFGTNDLKNINYDNVQYGKIIFTTDSDDDGLHIASLLSLFFFEKFPKLFNMGVVFVAMPPKYSFSEGGKFTYLKNDKELSDFEYSKVSTQITIDSGQELSYLMSIKENYMEKFNIIKNKYAMAEDIISGLNIPELYGNVSTADELIAQLDGLEINDMDNIIGIYNGIWHDINIDLLLSDIEQLDAIYNDGTIVKFTDTKKKETYEASLKEFFDYINSTFNFKYNYFKGLGEADPSELGETTLLPENRQLIQLGMSKTEETYAINKGLFGSGDTDRDSRREMIVDYFKYDNPSQ